MEQTVKRKSKRRKGIMYDGWKDKCFTKFYPGDKVVFLGASDTQVQFCGCADPRGTLLYNYEYEVEKVKMHSWHTTLKLKDIDGEFNSVYLWKTT